MGDKSMNDGVFINCQFCGRRIIQRKANGLFYFAFGKPGSSDTASAPVEIEIHGSVRIKCFRKSCRQWNTLNYFPESNNQPKAEGDVPQTTQPYKPQGGE
jgi:hypothetical protein